MSNLMDVGTSGKTEKLSVQNLVGGSLMQRMQWHLAWEKAYFDQQENSDSQQWGDGASMKNIRSLPVEDNAAEVTQLVTPLGDLSTKTIKCLGSSVANTFTTTVMMSPNIHFSTAAMAAEPIYNTGELPKSNIEHQLSKKEKNSSPTRHYVEMINVSEMDKVTMIRKGNDVRVYIHDSSLTATQGMKLLADMRDVLWRTGLRLLSVRVNSQTLWERGTEEQRTSTSGDIGIQIDKVY